MDNSSDFPNMFWGLILKPEKRYEQVVETPFHVSKACVEPTTAKGGFTSIYIEVDDEEFLVCNLSDKIVNENLNLNFNTGDKIVFKTAGNGTVHLTGYNIMEDDNDMMGYDSYSDSDGEEEESEDEETPALVNGKKRKNSNEISNSPAKKKDKKDLSPLDKLLLEKKSNGVPSLKEEKKKAEEMAKKLKEAAKKKDEDDEDSDDDEDDDDDDDDDDEDDDESGDEEESEDDDDDDEDDEDEDDEDEDEDMEVESPAKKMMNGKKEEKKTPLKQKPEEQKTPGKETESAKKKKKNKEKAQNGTDAQGDKKTPAKGDKPKETPAKTPNKENQPKQTPGKTPKRTLKGGIISEELKVGNGPDAKRGKMVGMYYEGKLKSNGKTFDSTLSGKPFRFRLGAGEVIKGWDIGVDGMKVGGKRRLTIPPQMAYGPQGAPPDIPPNSHLVFEVECKAVN